MRISHVSSETHGLNRVLMLFFLLLLVLLVPPLAQAEIKVITAEATYTMGDGETPSFAEAMALQKAKQMALEQAGTYVESFTKVQNYNLTTEEIQTIAGGILQVEVLNKSRTLIGDGLQFYVKIKATVTTDKLAELAQRIKGKNVAGEYKKLQEDYARLNREIENWKQLIAKTPPGTEREAALDQIRERGKAFVFVQKSESAFFQRLVTGEVLVSQGLNEQSVIDRLFQRVLEDGQVITVGQPKALPLSRNAAQSKVVVPLTLTASPSILLAAKETARTLAGVIEEAQPLHLVRSQVLIGEGETDRTASVTVTMLRVAKDLELARYFQERISNLSLFVELAKSNGQLAQCSIRYFSDVVLSVPDPDEAWGIRVVDSIVSMENARLDLFLKGEEMFQGHDKEGNLTGLQIREVHSYNAEIDKLDATINKSFDALRKSDDDIRADLSKEQQVKTKRRARLLDMSVAYGLFMRIAPVRSRLRSGGLYRVGRSSPSLSTLYEDNGYVAILNDPATLKLEFVLQQNQAKEIESIKARVIEIDAEKWEKMNDRDRCTVVR
jgi:hypothetical protein